MIGGETRYRYDAFFALFQPMAENANRTREKWFQDQQRDGGRILVERDGVVREIVKL